ncbi:MAG: primosomal protein N' [Candidatus Omnitrophica bacterium]|nr:primosomal protein N' [Candidatus Omnitrophota bacterium]
MKKGLLYAQVVLPLPLDRSFDYLIPSSLMKKVGIGKRVRVPFGKEGKVGYIVGFSSRSPLPPKSVKPLGMVIDEEPLLDERLFELSKRLRDYYLCSWGEALEAMLPTSLLPRKRGIPFSSVMEGPLETVPSLNEEQKRSFQEIVSHVAQERPATFLLVGPEGSGKMELTLQVIRTCLEKERSSIVLFPEISLLRREEERFRRRFGEKVCSLHSQLSPLKRYEIWMSLKKGNGRVVLGVRSAVFSPVQQLGLIVLYEEGDSSYKQEESPRYHARQIALMRSELEGCSILLESSVPSLESYAEVERGRYVLLRLSRTFPEKHPPSIRIVDMREELRDQKRKVLFSKELERKIAEVLKEKGQVLLFLNRRGFSTFIHCRKCGSTLRCPNCSISLKYHFEPKRLICHYCNVQEKAPEICPACRESYLQYSGVGTERVESEIHRLFPEARIGRLDADVAKSARSQEEALTSFRRGEVDLLVGTQMVVRELVPQGIPLVGILSADTLLNRPDFRSAERTFGVLSRLMSQAARAEGTGEVIIQTFSPEKIAFLADTSQDYSAFYQEEIRSRKELGFPPFGFLTQMTFSGKKEEKVTSLSNSFKKSLNRLKQKKRLALLGPAPCLVYQLKGEYRWQLLIKSEKPIGESLRKILKRSQESRAVKITVDVDPL